eukprot:TRINITY_DN3662_c0_g1_i1.p1 TRINITY_DN3662_c0_g1~~TRINITY_DN3662_c0_g1_i1.p1  ORF type:complete len:531 (+),score=79.98 TRINITY_DN3662_c0_g1_i1:247-1839(+)
MIRRPSKGTGMPSSHTTRRAGATTRKWYEPPNNGHACMLIPTLFQARLVSLRPIPRCVQLFSELTAPPPLWMQAPSHSIMLSFTQYEFFKLGRCGSLQARNMEAGTNVPATTPLDMASLSTSTMRSTDIGKGKEKEKKKKSRSDDEKEVVTEVAAYFRETTSCLYLYTGSLVWGQVHVRQFNELSYEIHASSFDKQHCLMRYGIRSPADLTQERVRSLVDDILHLDVRENIYNRILVRSGDLADEHAEAIVMSQNRFFNVRETLLARAIHAQAGPLFGQACDSLGESAIPGQVKVTPGFNLRARYVIHTNGPSIDNEDPDLHLEDAPFLPSHIPNKLVVMPVLNYASHQGVSTPARPRWSHFLENLYRKESQRTERMPMQYMPLGTLLFRTALSCVCAAERLGVTNLSLPALGTGALGYRRRTAASENLWALVYYFLASWAVQQANEHSSMPERYPVPCSPEDINTVQERPGEPIDLLHAGRQPLKRVHIVCYHRDGHTFDEYLRAFFYLIVSPTACKLFDGWTDTHSQG